MISCKMYTDMAAHRYALNSGDSNSPIGQRPCRICDMQMVAHHCAPSYASPDCHYCKSTSGIFCIHTKTLFASAPPSYAKVDHVCTGISASTRESKDLHSYKWRHHIPCCIFCMCTWTPRHSWAQFLHIPRQRPCWLRLCKQIQFYIKQNLYRSS